MKFLFANHIPFAYIVSAHHEFAIYMVRECIEGKGRCHCENYLKLTGDFYKHCKKCGYTDSYEAFLDKFVTLNVDKIMNYLSVGNKVDFDEERNCYSIDVQLSPEIHRLVIDTEELV